MDSPPQYVAPAPDSSIALLQQQTQQQNIDALGVTARMDTARLAMLYGQSQLAGQGVVAAQSPDIKSVMKAAG